MYTPKTMCPDSYNVYPHRRGIRTELDPKAVSQLDLIPGLLKGPPQKLSLKKSRLGEMPPYRVIQYPSLDPSMNILSVREEEEVPHGPGYKPGPFTHRSLKIPCNAIPQGKRNVEREPVPSMCGHEGPFRSVLCV